MESKTQYMKLSLRNRVYHSDKLVLLTENEKSKQTNKTKQGSTLNKLTEIGSESARFILLGQTDNFWSSFRLVIKLFG